MNHVTQMNHLKDNDKWKKNQYRTSLSDSVGLFYIYIKYVVFILDAFR